MRFPLLLALTLHSQKFEAPFSSRTSPIFFLSPSANHFAPTLTPEQVMPNLWYTPEACVDAANRARARVVWLGQTDPLLHPNIGQVVAALLKTGRYVFLHSSGTGLRKRIHEFQPHARLYLTIEATNHDSASHSSLESIAISQTFLEAIDGARLSGFCRCAHVTATAQTQAADTARLFDWLDAQGLEGFVVSSARSPKIAPDRKTIEKATEIQNAIRSRGWRSFSHLLEESSSTTASAVQETFRPGNVDACEESA